MSHHLALGLRMDLGFLLLIIHSSPVWVTARNQPLYGQFEGFVVHLISKFLWSVQGAASQVSNSLSTEPAAYTNQKVGKPFNFVLSRFWGYLKMGDFPAGLVNCRISYSFFFFSFFFPLCRKLLKHVFPPAFRRGWSLSFGEKAM